MHKLLIQDALKSAFRGSIVLTVAVIVAGCGSDAGKVYVCRGELLERYDQEFISNDKLAVLIFKDHVRLEGNSPLLNIVNHAPPRRNQKLNLDTLTICQSETGNQIQFDSYGCDFDKNISVSSLEITYGTFNLALRELVLHQYRRYKLNEPENGKVMHIKRGVYECLEKLRG